MLSKQFVASSKVNFKWAVNTSKGLVDFEPSSYTSEGTSSFLTYRPYSYQINQVIENKKQDDEEDSSPPPVAFGVVYCWAQNRVGWQKEPCIFSVRPAGMDI